jgi:hypothetical protein
MATSQNTSIEHELSKLSDQIHNLFFLSGSDDCSKAQLENYSERLTHIVRYAKSLGYRLALLCGKDGIDVTWQPL